MSKNISMKRWIIIILCSIAIFTIILPTLMGTVSIEDLLPTSQEEKVEVIMQDIENQVAQDFVAQYDIAKRSGSEMDAYTAASLAKAWFLQANDEYNYQKWHEIEQEHAKNLGLY